MNKVILQGRLVADPEYRNEIFPVASFTLAVSRRFKNKDTGATEADFISCQATNKTAENIARFFKKGDLIIVTGEWRTGSYTTKDGATRYYNRCQVTEFYFQPNNRNTDQPSAYVPQYNQSQQAQQAPTPVQAQLPVDEIPQAFDIDLSLDDELPF